MPFMRFNGWTVPLESCEEKILEIGGRTRSHSGTPLSDLITTKRIWTCRTKPLIEIQAKALEGLLLGRGHNFSFENDAYSGKGLAPASTNGQGFVPATAADGYPTIFQTNSSFVSVIDSNKYGSYSYWGVGDLLSVSNQLTVNQRTCEGTTADFTAIDSAALAMNTTYKWQGSQSLRIITSAAVNGVEGGFYVSTTGSDGDSFTASAWVFATTNTTIKARFNDVTNAATSGYGTYYIPANTWTRLFLNTFTVSGSDSTDLRFEIVENTADSNITFYVDALQVTQDNSSGTDNFYGYPWGNATITGAPTTYNTTWLTSFPDLTLSYWFHGSMGVWDENLIGLYGSDAVTTNGILVYLQEDPRVDIRVYSSGALVANLTDNTSIGDWHMVTFTVRRNGETGENIYTLYIDGVSVDTDNAGTPPLFSNFTTLNLYGSALALLDDLVITPYAMPAAQVLALYNMGKAYPQMPRFYIDGDTMPDDTLTVLAQGADIKSELLQGGAVNTDGTITWHNNLRRLSFDVLEE